MESLVSDIAAQRRDFMKSGVAACAATLLSGLSAGAAQATAGLKKGQSPFTISLAEWSLHRTLGRDGRDNLLFPAIAKTGFEIDGVEYVNQFFMDKAKDQEYLKELKQRCDDLGVTSVLIMCDGEGQIGDPNEQGRIASVDKHKKWVEAAKFLGCHSIRVNASSGGSREEQAKLAADGLRRLSEYAADRDINVLVENHGGLSSDGEWLAGVIRSVGLPNCGTLPDFGNFHMGNGKNYDRYQGVKELMPLAKAVSAKSHVFDSKGNESEIDYLKMMKIVTDAGYHGRVGIEWEGSKPGEMAGILLTKHLLERVREKLAG